MPKLLTKLKLNEVSLVPAPANPGARVLMFKSLDGGPDPDPGTPDAALSAEADALAAATLKSAGLGTKEQDMTEKTAAEKAEVQKQIDTAVADAVAKATAALTEQATKAQAQAAELAKSLEAANKAAADALKMAEDARKAADAERENRELIELTAIAEKSYSALPGEPLAKAQALRELTKLPEAARKTVEAMLTAAQTAMKAQLSEVGKAGAPAGAGSAEAELERLAKGIEVAEKVSYAKAYDLALERNPVLYAKYRAEQRGAAA